MSNADTPPRDTRTYRVLSADDAAALESLVNDAIAEGWTRTGNLVVTSHFGHVWYPGEHEPSRASVCLFAQAMVRP